MPLHHQTRWYSPRTWNLWITRLGSKVSVQRAHPHHLSAMRHLPPVRRILMPFIHLLRRTSKHPQAQQRCTVQLKKQADSGSRTLSFRARRHHNARALGTAIALCISYKLYNSKELFAGHSDCTNATHAYPWQYHKRPQKFASHQMV